MCCHVSRLAAEARGDVIGHGRNLDIGIVVTERWLVAVIADTGLFVWCDVGRIKRAERQVESQAAGIFLATFGGVAQTTALAPFTAS